MAVKYAFGLANTSLVSNNYIDRFVSKIS